jgi:hypothetical protein
MPSASRRIAYHFPFSGLARPLGEVRDLQHEFFKGSHIIQDGNGD